MIADFPGLPFPDWLWADVPPHPMPLRDVLHLSVFCPVRHFDAQPVRYIAGHLHSFVYAEEEPGIRALHQKWEQFRGYDVLWSRDIYSADIDNDPSPPTDVPLQDPAFAKGAYLGTWSMYRRRIDMSLLHGSDRFSVFYTPGCGALAFDNLYRRFGAVPAMVAILQPRSPCIDRADRENPRGRLARTIMTHGKGIPNYLIFGGPGKARTYEQPCWPWFGEHVRRLHDRLHLWQRMER